MRKWTPLLAVCLGTFMLLIDVTIVNVALPDITRDLEASFSQVQWVIDIYALSLAALMLGAGGLADALGRRRIYLAGLTVFALASVACGLSQDITVLIIGRAVQGIGGAAMFATTVALINVSYSGRDRGTAYGIWGAVAGASAGVGSVIGGVLTDLLSWRWAFWVNLPVSVLAIALSIAVFADAERRRVRLDVPGMVTFTAAAGLITYAIIEAGESSWTSRTPVVSAVLGLLALAAFVLLERRAEHPLIDLTLLRSPVFTGAVLAAAVLSSAAFGSSALVSIWLQSVVGLSPLQTGLALLPMSVVAFAVAGFLSSRLHGVPVARPIGAGLFLIGCGSLLMLFVRAGSSWTALLAGLLVVGLGVRAGHAAAHGRRPVGGAGAAQRDGVGGAEHLASARAGVRGGRPGVGFRVPGGIDAEGRGGPLGRRRRLRGGRGSDPGGAGQGPGRVPRPAADGGARGLRVRVARGVRDRRGRGGRRGAGRVRAAAPGAVGAGRSRARGRAGGRAVLTFPGRPDRGRPADASLIDTTTTPVT